MHAIMYSLSEEAFVLSNKAKSLTGFRLFYEELTTTFPAKRRVRRPRVSASQ